MRTEVRSLCLWIYLLLTKVRTMTLPRKGMRMSRNKEQKDDEIFKDEDF